MSKVLSLLIAAAGIISIAGFSGCAGNSSQETKAKVADSAAVVYVNPRKGKIWEKENIVKIPLTAIENQLVGKVKTVTYREYDYSDKENDDTKVLVDSGHNEYDKAGHLISQSESYGDKVPKWQCTYKYENETKPLEWNVKIFEEEMDSKTTFKYDAKGQKIEEITTDRNREYARRTTYTYDEKGNMIEVHMFDKDDRLKQVINYKYDQNGFQTSYTEKDEDGEVFSKLTCLYDMKGNKVGGADYSSDSTMESKWLQTNDKQGRRIETEYFTPDGKVLEKRNIKYDDHGFATEYNTYKADGSLDELKSYSYKNEYDKTGNIIKQIEVRWKGGKRLPVTYAEYEITYH